MDKQQGHPSTVVPKDKVLSYLVCLHQWISNDQLARYLKDPEQSVEALRTLEESQQADLDPVTLNRWCDTWLSENGWEQLQDNVTRYHHRQKEGAKYKRVMLERDTVDDLYKYAAQQGLSVNDAVQALLQIALDVKQGKVSKPLRYLPVKTSRNS